MMTVLLVELLRLRRSLAVALVVAAPCSLSLLALVILLDRGRTVEWRLFADSTTAIWAYLMLPMAATALSVLLAHVEQAARGWDHLLALPGWRGRFFAAKFATLMLLLAAMSALLVLAMVAAGMAADGLSGGRLLSGEPPLGHLVDLIARMWIAAGLVGLLQIWVALRLRSFVPPLVLGISGTLVGVVTASARQGIYVPWLLPVNMLSSPERAQAALTTALIGSTLLLPIMLMDLSRRECR
jgi:hypothetical protein